MQKTFRITFRVYNLPGRQSVIYKAKCADSAVRKFRKDYPLVQPGTIIEI